MAAVRSIGGAGSADGSLAGTRRACTRTTPPPPPAATTLLRDWANAEYELAAAEDLDEGPPPPPPNPRLLNFASPKA